MTVSYEDLCKAYIDSSDRDREWVNQISWAPEQLRQCVERLLGLAKDEYRTIDNARHRIVTIQYPFSDDPKSATSGPATDNSFFNGDYRGVFALCILLERHKDTYPKTSFQIATVVKTEAGVVKFSRWDAATEAGIGPLSLVEVYGESVISQVQEFLAVDLMKGEERKGMGFL